jgi:hypothetical protein
VGLKSHASSPIENKKVGENNNMTNVKKWLKATKKKQILNPKGRIQYEVKKTPGLSKIIDKGI